MSDTMTAEVFTPHIGKAFRPRGWHGSLTLVSAEPYTRPGWEAAPRKPFSLIFRGVRDDILPEGLYVFDVDGGAVFEFYVSPIHTPAPDHQDYQAAFT